MSYFTLNNIPLQANSGIMFGGTVTDSTRVYRTNDVYTVTMTKDSVVS